MHDHLLCCSVSAQSDTARIIREAELIVWDEAPMMHKGAYEAVSRTFQDLMRNDLPFGGKTVVLGGDFRQVCPVVRKGSRGKVVAASLKNAAFWQQVQRLSLTINMRVMTAGQGDAEDLAAWADYLLQLGEGRVPTHPGQDEGVIRLPQEMCKPGLTALIEHVYDPDRLTDKQFLVERAILTPLNETVDQLNQNVISKLDSEQRTYLSDDKVVGDTDPLAFPEEFLHSVKVNGVPPHELTLKRGCPVMLLRNLNSTQGLANGTRLLVHQFQQRVLDCEIISGSELHIGKRVFIPRIKLIPTDSNMPFEFSRKQFPLRVAYAMSINKAQGQTMQQVGVWLPKPVFSHGQLYVAMSRVGAASKLKIAVQRDSEHPLDRHYYTTNVVYPEVLG